MIVSCLFFNPAKHDLYNECRSSRVIRITGVIFGAALTVLGVLLIRGIIRPIYLWKINVGVLPVASGPLCIVAALNFKCMHQVAKLHAVGSQKGCSGAVDRQKSSEYFNNLNNRLPQSVSFDSSRLVDNITGGVCTPMALTFLGMRKQGLSGCPQCASEEDRNLQAALNCIEVKGGSDDIARDKVQALLNIKEVQIQAVAARFDLSSWQKSDVIKELLKLKTGTFFVRSLKLANNHKQEEYGHSTVLLIGPESIEYYDPCHGVFQVNERASLYQLLTGAHGVWDVPMVSIYELA